MKKIWIAACLLLPACLPFGQKARHQALCGKATLQLLANLQKEYRAAHGKYAGFLEQLNQDPPLECRDDWFYRLETANDGQSFLLSVEQRSVHETWTIDDKEFLRDPAENAARAKGKI